VQSKASFILINTTKTTLGPSTLIQYLHSRKILADYIYAPKDANILYSDKELELLLNEISSYSIVGISSFTISEARAFQISHAIKNSGLKIHVTLGGPNVIMDPDRILLESKADSVCTYEGEVAVETLICNFQSKNYKSTKGLWFKDDDKIIQNPHSEVIENLDSINYENYKKSRYGTYKRLSRDGFTAEQTMTEVIENPCMQGKFLYMMTTRGCPHSCSFCINATLHEIGRQVACPMVRRMSPVKVIDGLRGILEQDSSAEYVFFFDDDFSLRNERDLEVFAELYRKEVNLPFYVFANPNYTTNRKLDIYADAGLASIEFGVQSVSERILKIYNRMQNANDLIRILKHVAGRKYDIEISFDLITNSPFETAEDVIANIKYVLSLPGSFQLYVHNLHIFPGSPLRQKYGRGTGNEFYEYQDNVCSTQKRFYNEYHTKILFAMQGVHESEHANMYGTLLRGEIESLAMNVSGQDELIHMLNRKIAETQVAKYYNGLYNS